MIGMTDVVDEIVLGRQLRMVRGLYWSWGRLGDDYSTLLCGLDSDRHVRWERLRAAGASRSTGGTVVVADHATARQVLDDPALCRGATPATPEWSRAAGAPPAAWAGPFRAVHAAPWDGDVPGSADLAERLAGVAPPPGSRCDLVSDLAAPLVAHGLAHSAGPGHAEVLHAAAHDTRVALDAALTPQTLAVTLVALAALPSDPAQRALVAAAAAATAVLADAVLTVSGEPQLAARLADEPDACGRVVAEVLRLRPALHLERRTAAGPTRVGPHDVGEGDEVVVAVEAANRDPAAFTDPGALDPDRADAGRTLTAERGRPGRGDDLVAAVVTAGLRAVTPLLPRLAPEGPAVRSPRSPVLRGVARCPVET